MCPSDEVELDTGSTNFIVLPSISSPYLLLAISITIILSCVNALIPLLAHVDRNDCVCAHVVGRLNDGYKLENGLPLFASFCTAVNLHVVALTVLHPVAEKGNSTVDSTLCSDDIVFSYKNLTKPKF